ncbi:MAG TPA: alpha/beta fold hydrolase [Xanthomonadales bacterium]|nr:alpha/beta fold hydrolase [Xanthomonadales bacterium]
MHTTDGLALEVEHYGPDDGRAIVFAHGFGQTRHAWSATAARLAERGYRCLTADGRGHGESAWLDGGDYTLDHFIDDARRLAASLHPQDRPEARPIWVGASMGGLLGLLAEAESAGGLFDALVLVDITPRWEAQGVARIMEFMRAHLDGFASVEDAQRAIQAYLPHRSRDRSPERLNKLLVRMANGRLRWHWDPRLLGTIAEGSAAWGERMMAGAKQLRLPVLLVSGGRSDVVSDHTIAEFRELVPHAEHRRIDDATHMVVGDANDRFTHAISTFIDGLAARAPSPSGRS